MTLCMQLNRMSRNYDEYSKQLIRVSSVYDYIEMLLGCNVNLKAVIQQQHPLPLC